MKSVVIAPVGENIDALFVGIREFPTEKVVLVTTTERKGLAEKTKKRLDEFKIPADIVEVKGNPWESTFRAVAEIKNSLKGKNILVNVATGDPDTRCATTSAAFVNGLKAFAVGNNQVMMLPILKFSYYRILSDQKMKILNVLNDDDECCVSLEELSKRVRMSLPLVSYHINGNQKSEGLKEMGLIETRSVKGRIEVHLSMIGRLLLKGYIPEKEESAN